MTTYTNHPHRFPVLTPVMLASEYCAYQHVSAVTGEPIHTGVTKLSGVMSTGAPNRRSAEWFEKARDGFTVRILLTGDRSACQARAAQEGYSPPRNPRASSVRRVSDGQAWESVAAAARAAGVAASTMSNHLNAVDGYRTVKGEQYERI